MPRHTVSFLAARLWLSAASALSIAQNVPPFKPPTASAQLLNGVPFAAGHPIGGAYRQRFTECDVNDTCMGKKQKYRCTDDRSSNTVLLDLPHDVVFFDAKMAVDADGSPLSKNHHNTDQPETSLRYPGPDQLSIDADKVPYIAVPGGQFMNDLRIDLGDVAAVVYHDKIVYALVADVGPPCKIGEGSIELHERLGHHACTSRNAKGACEKIRDVSIPKDVLYFVFRGSKSRIWPGLTPQNVNERVATEGASRMNELRH